MSVRTRVGFLELGTAVTYRPRQKVIHQGEESHHVLVLLEGLMKVFVDTESGRPVLLGLRGRGDLLGEMSVLEGRRRSANVMTCTPTQVRLIKNAQFRNFLDRHPDAWAAIAASLSARLHWANNRRAEFVACPAPVRVSRVLAEMARRHGLRASDGWTLDVCLTQAEIASLAGVALATFEKALQSLRDSGLVRRRARRIVITDLAGLARFSVLNRQNPYQYGVRQADVAQS
ncbi:Crp/Fnr family transcriptional regulator [Amycolatopsis magusensis]|uniref:CRP-like cAMP-binding protein n=1 Tax=Amycolatopsis magusensis TaxID=882444 RepID=A0ABS4PZ39_9PSEU|nr:Crp/Fnr family transcriptional regulator [Amycolatopsis magusensis]MBP2184573.1 CRP-like cAMP-binding protein [Amycolatopsis magusensis]